MTMKLCPFCAEEIQDAAVKCKHCGEFLDPRFKPADAGKNRDADRPWFFRTGTVVSALLCLTALALPLVWFNPYYSRRTKVVVTIIVGAVTYFALVALAQATKSLNEYYKLIF